MNIKFVTNNKAHFEKIGWDSFAEVNEVIKYFEGKPIIAYDSETSGLGFMFSDMWCIQLGDSENQFVVDLKSINIISFKNLLETKILLGHNILFDIVFLYKEGIYPYKIYDTFLAESLLSQGIRIHVRTLKACLKRYLDIELGKEERTNIITKGLDSINAIEYSGLDVAFLHQLYELQNKSITKWELEKVLEIEHNNILAIAYMELCGFPVNKEVLYKWVRKKEYEEYGALLALNDYATKTYPNLLPENFEDNFNWSSSQQVVSLFNKIGIKTFSSKDEKDSVEAKFIKKQADKYPIITEYLNYRELEKVVSTYGRTWFDYIMSDGRIHTKFKPMVETGRMSSGSKKSGPFPNIQNVIQDNNFRKIFQAPKGRTFVKCDYSGQESVIMADFSQEPKLLKFYQEGEADMHSYVAKMIYPKELKNLTLNEVKQQYPHLRQNAKSAGFAIQYGGNGYTIAENANIPVKEGEAIYEAYMKAFPKLKDYFDKCHKEAMRNGFVLVNKRSKRKRFIYGMRAYKSKGIINPRFEGEVFRMSLNTPCQGTGADMTKEASYLFFKWIRDNKLIGKVFIVNIIHDEIIAECSLSRKDEVANALQACMETAGNLYLSTLHIKAEPEINYCWKK